MAAKAADTADTADTGATKEMSIGDAMKAIAELEQKVAGRVAELAKKIEDGVAGVAQRLEDHIADVNAKPQASASPPAAHVGPLEISIFGVPEDAAVGEAFDGGVLARGGSGAHSFHIESGKLPDGLSMAAGGAITGTPTAEGDFACRVAVTDANSDKAVADVEIFVAPAPVEEPEPEPAAAEAG